MKENLKDILSNLNPDIDQETLLLYLQGKLTPEKQHELELKMMEGDFESDALEGLSGMKNKQHVAGIVEQLQHDLRNKTAKRKSRQRKMQIKSDPTLWIAVLIILFLIIISYIIIHFAMKQ